MTDELDERLPHGLPDGGMRGQRVGDGEERKEYADADDLQRLEHHVLPAEARQPLVPDGSQQLLHVRVGNELEQKHNTHWLQLLYKELLVTEEVSGGW